MHLARGRSFLLLGLLIGPPAYVGCSERNNVARNPSEGGEAGMGTDTTASGTAGTLGAGASSGATAGGSDGASDAGAGAAATGDAGAGGVAGAGPAGPCGALSFAPAVPYDIKSSGLVSRGLAAGDLDGDGFVDLVVSYTEAGAEILLNQGDGTFDAPFSIPARGPAQGDPVDIITFDANGDEKLDLAFVNYPGAVAISLNQGGAMFDAPVDYAISGGLTSVVAGELTGDGKPDLAVSLQAGGAAVLVNQGDGTFEDAVPYVAGAVGWSLAIADFDGQNGQDLVVTTALGDQNGPLSVLLNDGDGTFGAEQPYMNPVGSTYCYVTAAELGGDDRPDIALSCGEPAVLINTSSSNGSFMGSGAWSKKALPIGDRLDPGGRLVTVDLLSSGRRDVVMANGSPLNVYLNQGDANFAPAEPFAFPASTPGGSAVVSADFNTDGKPDLAVVTDSSTDGLSVLLNTCVP